MWLNAINDHSHCVQWRILLARTWAYRKYVAVCPSAAMYGDVSRRMSTQDSADAKIICYRNLLQHAECDVAGKTAVLRFPALFGGLRGNVRWSSYARWKASRGLPISVKLFSLGVTAEAWLRLGWLSTIQVVKNTTEAVHHGRFPLHRSAESTDRDRGYATLAARWRPCLVCTHILYCVYYV